MNAWPSPMNFPLAFAPASSKELSHTFSSLLEYMKKGTGSLVCVRILIGVGWSGKTANLKGTPFV